MNDIIEKCLYIYVKMFVDICRNVCIYMSIQSIHAAHISRSKGHIMKH